MKKENKKIVEAVIKKLGLREDEPELLIQLGIDMLAYVVSELSKQGEMNGVIAGTFNGDTDYIFAVGEIARDLKSEAVEKQYDEYKKI